MNHPNREEWIPYLFGEVDPQTRKDLATHLNGCPQCSTEVRDWRRSLQRLDAWKTPPRYNVRRLPAVRPVLNLAAAALLVLGLGFGFGHWFAAPNRAQLQSSLKATLIPELRQELGGEFAANWQARIDQFTSESSNALARVKADAMLASASEMDRALQQVLDAIRSGRAEDQATMAGLLDNLQKQHESDLIALRKDLETVASLTEEQIRAARLKLFELTAYTPSETTP
jgi:hypothetical protein